MMHDSFNVYQTPQNQPKQEENIIDILIQTGLKAKDVVEKLTSIETVDELLTQTRQQKATIQELHHRVNFQENALMTKSEEIENRKKQYMAKCQHLEVEITNSEKLVTKIKKLEKRIKAKKTSK